MAQHKLIQSPCQDWFLHSDGYCDLKNKLNLLITIHFLGKYVKTEKKEGCLCCIKQYKHFPYLKPIHTFLSVNEQSKSEMWLV